MKLYAFPLVALMLTACGGGSDKAPTSVIAPQTQIKLDVSLSETSVSLDENALTTVNTMVAYNGNDSVSFSYDVIDKDSSSLISVEYSDGVITVNTKEVITDTSVQIKATFSAGNLTEEKIFTVNINDVANNYTLNTTKGIEEVRGNPSKLTLVNTTFTKGDVVSFPSENGVALYFTEHESPYFIALDSLDNITSYDEVVAFIDQNANTLAANGLGKSIISLTFASIQKQFTINVTTNKPVVTGKVNYQRVEFIPDNSGIPGNIKLDIENPTVNPVRLVVVNLLDEEGVLVASTVSSIDGTYKFELAKEDINKAYKIEIRAQLELDDEVNDGFKIVVTDQSTAETLPEQTVYNHVTPVFDLSSGINQQDVTLTVGWNDEAKVFDAPIAQPFGILDTIYKTASYLASGGVTYSDSLDDLVINWSQKIGSIERQSAFYSSSENRIFLNGEKLDEASIEEWSEVVISHEFTHFYQKKILGRDDSTGGTHQHWDPTQITVAFSEGLAQAIAYAVHGEWADKRAQPDVLAYSSADDYHVIAQDELASNCKTERTLHDGSTAQFNCHRFSPWEEVTNSYFILSLISNKTETPRTANLSGEIGIGGLHRALTQAAQSEAYMSVYSLATALKNEFNGQTASIDNLAQKLGFIVEDAVDIDGNPHSYEFYSKYKGQTPELANLFPNGRLDESEFKAYAGQEYVIDIRGRRYEETAPFTDSNGNTFSVYPFAKNENVCTNVTITKQ